MSITRIGAEDAATGLPFARAAGADGWLYVSGQVPMADGQIVSGGIIPQAHQAIKNMLAIMEEAGYDASHIVRIGVWLEDPRDFNAFNTVFRHYFVDNPPARACVESRLMVDGKVEVDCVAYKAP